MKYRPWAMPSAWEIQDTDLTEVMHSLNALLEALDGINPPGLESVEPLPILLPPRHSG